MDKLRPLELDELLNYISTAQSTPRMKALDELALRGIADQTLLPILCETLGQYASFERRAPPPACMAFERIFESNNKTAIAALLDAAESWPEPEKSDLFIHGGKHAKSLDDLRRRFLDGESLD